MHPVSDISAKSELAKERGGGSLDGKEKKATERRGTIQAGLGKVNEGVTSWPAMQTDA